MIYSRNITSPVSLKIKSFLSLQFSIQVNIEFAATISVLSDKSIFMYSGWNIIAELERLQLAARWLATSTLLPVGLLPCAAWEQQTTAYDSLLRLGLRSLPIGTGNRTRIGSRKMCEVFTPSDAELNKLLSTLHEALSSLNSPSRVRCAERLYKLRMKYEEIWAHFIFAAKPRNQGRSFSPVRASLIKLTSW